MSDEKQNNKVTPGFATMGVHVHGDKMGIFSVLPNMGLKEGFYRIYVDKTALSNGEVNIKVISETYHDYDQMENIVPGVKGMGIDGLMTSNMWDFVPYTDPIRDFYNV